MGLDGFLRHHADRRLARRWLRFLLVAPLVTVPLTAAIDMFLLGPVDHVEQRSTADVVLLHLPGVANLYPTYCVATLGRLNRTLILPAVLGIMSYAVPQLYWLALVEVGSRVPPPAPIPATGVIVESFFCSFVLWCLTWSVYQASRDR